MSKGELQSRTVDLREALEILTGLTKRELREVLDGDKLGSLESKLKTAGVRRTMTAAFDQATGFPVGLAMSEQPGPA